MSLRLKKLKIYYLQILKNLICNFKKYLLYFIEKRSQITLEKINPLINLNDYNYALNSKESQKNNNSYCQNLLNLNSNSNIKLDKTFSIEICSPGLLSHKIKDEESPKTEEIFKIADYWKEN